MDRGVAKFTLSNVKKPTVVVSVIHQQNIHDLISVFVMIPKLQVIFVPLMELCAGRQSVRNITRIASLVALSGTSINDLNCYIF